jgi:membrane-associated phospholipid phosphatase
MVLINSIYDILSLFIHFILVDVVYRGISGDIMYPLGLIFTLSVERILKTLTTNNTFVPFKRPEGACDCNLFNDGGIVENNSGFPSGHVASTCVYMSLLYFENGNMNINMFIIYQIPTILMGIARYMKKCHNILQISFGASIGFIVAYILFYKFKKNTHHNNIKTIS